MKGLEAKTLGLKKVIRHEYKRIVAFMLTVAMVVTNFGTNLTVAFAAGEEESSLFLLDSSELDAAIYGCRKFQEEHLILAVPGSFAINDTLTAYQLPVEDILNKKFLDASCLPVPLSCFQNEPFIMLKPENDTGKRARTICEDNQFEPNVILEMDQQMTSYNITCSGMGISFIGDVMLSKVPLTSDVVYYKLPAGESSRDIRFYWKNGRYQTRAMEEFLKMACQ